MVTLLISSSTSLMQLLLQKLERLQEEGQIEKPFQRKQMKIRFPERGRSGRTVLMLKNLEFGYEDEVRRNDH